MPAKQTQRAEVNTFVQGFITEASPLNFPENASLDEENFELNRDGSRNRRLGMDYEEGTILRETGFLPNSVEEAAVRSFEWTEVAGDSGLKFLVVQINRRLDFYDLNKEKLSSEGYLGTITINEFPTNTRYSMSTIEGLLVVVSGIDVFTVVKYNPDNKTFSYRTDRIRIRDLFGVEETISEYEKDDSYRGGLDIRHYYNLQNQSWGIPRRVKYTTTEDVYGWKNVPNPNYDPNIPGSPYYIEIYTKTGTKTVSKTGNGDPVSAYQTHYGFAPSNGESVWLGLQFSPSQYNAQSEKMEEPKEELYARMFSESWGAEIQTARGYYIIDALRRGQSRVDQMARNEAKYPKINKIIGTNTKIFNSFNLPSDYTEGGPSVTAEFAGRIFYSGFQGIVRGGDGRSPNYTNYVFFSTLVKNRNDLGKCYQDGDPTSRDSADVVDTDGGFLRISEAKGIQSLVNIGTSLIVIAENGVWAIDGGSDYGFSATNYRVDKISTFGSISPSTVVLENNRLYFWAEDGIYTVSRDEFGDLRAESISIGTIQTWYDTIPNISKREANAIYDSTTKKIRWVFQQDECTKELVLDTTIGSFSINRIMNLEEGNNKVVDVFQTSPYVTGTQVENIMVGTDKVMVEDEEVAVTLTQTISGVQATKYLTLSYDQDTVKYGFSLYRNIRYKDWESVDGNGVDAKAYCLTGYQTVGDSGTKKQIPYLTIHFIRTEDGLDNEYIPLNQSGCMFRGHWGFTNSIKSGRWTPLMQAYRYKKPVRHLQPGGEFDSGYKVVTSKNKLRGSGKAFSLYFETEPEKDCRILGWNITLTGNAVT